MYVYSCRYAHKHFQKTDRREIERRRAAAVAATIKKKSISFGNQ